MRDLRKDLKTILSRTSVTSITVYYRTEEFHLWVYDNFLHVNLKPFALALTTPKTLTPLNQVLETPTILSEGLIYPNTKVTLPQVYALISVYLKRDLKEIYTKGLSPWQKETLRILEKKATVYV